ncbi:MAG: hotdog fold thioesterase [Lysobacterales bacterium]|jgi:1,4-dihydroxy-2-naphthoyl-CoA hydrolase
MEHAQLSQICGDLVALNRMHQGNMAGHIGIEVTAIGRDFVRASMPVDERTKQPMGLLHGGASVVLAETLGSVASFLLVSGTPGARVAGLDINATHIKKATSGQVHGVCRPLRLGRTVHFWQIDIFDDEGEQTCSSRLSVAISRKREKAT